MTDRAIPPAPLRFAGNYAAALRRYVTRHEIKGSTRARMVDEAALMLERQQAEIKRLTALVESTTTVHH